MGLRGARVIALVVAVLSPALVWAGSFRIVYPADGASVGAKVVELEGEGAVPGATIDVEVLTNEWYPQKGRAQINADGTWSYGPCHLGGTGEYNRHTIKAQLVQDGKVVATARVRDVVRKD